MNSSTDLTERGQPARRQSRFASSCKNMAVDKEIHPAFSRNFRFLPAVNRYANQRNIRQVIHRNIHICGKRKLNTIRAAVSC